MAKVEARRQRAIWLAWAGALAFAAGLGAAVAAPLVVFKDRIPAAIVGIGLIAVVALGLLGGMPMWRRLDDMARQAHTTAWYFGGSAGMGVGFVALAMTAGPHSPMAMGAFLLMLAQLAGYGVAWAGWWAARRGR